MKLAHTACRHRRRAWTPRGLPSSQVLGSARIACVIVTDGRRKAVRLEGLKPCSRRGPAGGSCVQLSSVATLQRRSPELLPQPVTIGDTDGQHFLELLQQRDGLGSVVPVALQPCHKLALVGYVALGLGKVSLGGRQTIFKHRPVHAATTSERTCRSA
jgi:hypothetical protein